MSKTIGWVVAGVGVLVLAFVWLRRSASTTPARVPAYATQPVATAAPKTSTATEVGQWLAVGGAALGMAQNLNLW